MIYNSFAKFSLLSQVQLLGMPYVGGEMSMFVLLPKQRFGLDKLLAGINRATLLEWIQKRQKLEVQVFTFYVDIIFH
jgi:serine protease inhibitor